MPPWAHRELIIVSIVWLHGAAFGGATVFRGAAAGKKSQQQFWRHTSHVGQLEDRTRLMLAFGGLALVVALLMAMALAGIGDAEQSLQGGTVAAAQLQAVLAPLHSARA